MDEGGGYEIGIVYVTGGYSHPPKFINATVADICHTQKLPIYLLKSPRRP